MFPERYRDLVSAKVGVIRQVGPQPRGAEEAVPPHLCIANLAHFDFRASEASERIGAGKGETEEEAMAAAIGEAIERYCAFQWDPARTYLANWESLRPAAISPAECVLYSEAQYCQPDFRYRRWNASDEVAWIDGTELPSGRRVAMPASLVYLVHPAPRPEDFFTSASSNGLAAGPTPTHAILGGLCELIERDTFLISWMNRLPAIEIDLASAGEPAGRLWRHYAHFNVTLRAFVLPTDLPATTVLALGMDPNPRRPAQIVALGCHPSPRTALRKALFELCQGRPAEARRFTDKPPQNRLVKYSDVKTLDDHSAFHSLPEQAREFEFLWARGQRARIDEFPEPETLDAETALAHCAEALSANGHRVAWADLTLPDVRQCGLHVVRTLATGLQPIHFGHGQERLGGRRLFEVPRKLGLSDRLHTVADLNPCPHPMA